MSSFLLSEEEFHRCCQLLLQRSEELRDGWSWESVRGTEEGFLRKTALRSVAVASRWELEQEPEGQQFPLPATAAPEGTNEDLDEEDEGTCTVSQSSTRVLQFEYHILHSCSYGTPVLYFRACTLEGRSLSLEDVWSSVHPSYQRRLLEGPLNTITQQEHPLLAEPFFMLHPCRTEEFMRPVLQAEQDGHRPVNYVLSWLSIVGPVVGLEVSLKYSTLLHPADPLSGDRPS